MGLLSWLGLESEPVEDPISLNDQNFAHEVGEAKLPVLIDVWSPGCGPCLSLVPTVRRLAGKYKDRVKVCQLDASTNRKSVEKLNVRATPTIIFMKGGQEVERVVGMRGQHYFEEIIEEEFGLKQ